MAESSFQEIDQKWQDRWEKEKAFKVNENSKKPKYYVLEQFPYPSGTGLHIGHAFVYTIGDIYARFKRMNGFNVLYPMGYDSLGLPAENAAVKAGINPKKYTDNSIKYFSKQQKALGLSYDWDRMFWTHDQDYYKWDQWIFLKMFEKNLVYQKKSPVNWCPKCDTVLANEQVHSRKCWIHSDTQVEIRHLNQWYLKITEYADELADFKTIEKWPDVIKKLQKNWIGKSHGTEILFEINGKNWPIFTTRPDTVYGVTFMVISAQHPDLNTLVTKEQKKEVEKFIKKLSSVSQEQIDQLEKEGVFTGSYAVNPVNKEKIPVYAGNFVLADYGCGMVMAVPAHDQRDFEFAKKYSIPIRIVIQPDDYEINPKKMSRAYTGDGRLVNSNEFNNWNNRNAIEEITKFLEKNKQGKPTVQFRLKDWLISRQRYWGTPIPVVYCSNCAKNLLKFDNYKSYLMGASKIDNDELKRLNIKIDKTDDGDRRLLIPNNKIENYLKIIENKLDEGFWNEVVGNKVIFIFKFKGGKIKKFILEEENQLEIAKLCAEFNNQPFERTENLLEYLLDNEFYKDYVKKIKSVPKKVTVPLDEKNLPVELPEKVKFGKGNPLETAEDWKKVKCPKCKSEAERETDTMDTFVNSSWYYLRYCDPKNKTKIFDPKKTDYWTPIDMYIGGKEHACMHDIYIRFYTKFLRDIGLLKINEPAIKLFVQGMVHGEDGNKMSKSIGNVIDPMDIIKEHGADSLRLFLVSVASPDSDFNWSNKGIQGINKFLRKFSESMDNLKIGKSSKRLESKLNKTIKEVTEYIENFKYNLAVIKLRALLDLLIEENEVSKKDFSAFLKLMSVFCPHITEDIWEKIGNRGFISLSEWPKLEEDKIDEKMEKQEENVEKSISDIMNILKLMREKQGKEGEKIYIYVMSNEYESYNPKKLSLKIGKEVNIFKVNDRNKYDPENRSGKSKPGKPGIYVE